MCAIENMVWVQNENPVMNVKVQGKRLKGRPKARWIDRITREAGITEEEAQNCTFWR